MQKLPFEQVQALPWGDPAQLPDRQVGQCLVDLCAAPWDSHAKRHGGRPAKAEPCAEIAAVVATEADRRCPARS